MVLGVSANHMFAIEICGALFTARPPTYVSFEPRKDALSVSEILVLAVRAKAVPSRFASPGGAHGTRHERRAYEGPIGKPRVYKMRGFSLIPRRIEAITYGRAFLFAEYHTGELTCRNPRQTTLEVPRVATQWVRERVLRVDGSAPEALANRKE